MPRKSNKRPENTEGTVAVEEPLGRELVAEQPVAEAAPPAEIEVAAPIVPGTTISLADLQMVTVEDLQRMAREQGVETVATLKKHEIIFEILKRHTRSTIIGEGVL